MGKFLRQFLAVNYNIIQILYAIEKKAYCVDIGNVIQFISAFHIRNNEVTTTQRFYKIYQLIIVTGFPYTGFITFPISLVLHFKPRNNTKGYLLQGGCLS